MSHRGQEWKSIQKKSMKEIRGGTLLVSLIALPSKALGYWMLAGIGFAVGVTIIDGGWEPTARKYVAFFLFSLVGLGWGVVAGIQHYFFTKKLYGEQWKEE